MEDRQRDTVLIFDYDGTLHDSGLIYVPAFRRMYDTMVRDGIAESRNWEPEEINHYLGYSAVEMWLEFMPGIDRELMESYCLQVGEEMRSIIEEGDAKWYDGAAEVLQELKDRGYRMVVLSNCRKTYMDINREAFGMDRFFEGYYDCESYDNAPKTEIFREIRREHPASKYIVIGDRRHDLEVAVTHQLPFIGCTYGYGKPEELENVQTAIGDIRELLTLLP